MPSITGYQNDVFISYAHADNEASEDIEPWVTRLVVDLQRSLGRRLGTKPEIYFDLRRLSTGAVLDELLDNVSKAAVLVAIVSPSYVRRDWTRDELRVFMSTTAASSRICPIEMLPLDSEQDYPKEFVTIKRALFWHPSVDSQTPITIRVDLDHERYYAKIEDLAEDLKKKLRQMSFCPSQPSISTIAATPPIHVAKSKTLLLAQVTEDLEDERENVRRHLEQFGLTVLPTTTYPQGGAAFRMAFEGDCDRARLFVQMLGPTQSRSPPDLGNSYAYTQYELATQHGLDRMLWRRPDLRVDEITHRDAHLLTAPEIEAIGLESFKAEIVSNLIAPESAAHARPSSANGFVFINASQTDLALAKTLYDEVKRNKYSAVLPSFDGPAEVIRVDLEDTLVDCSALVLVYGSTGPTWVRGQLRLFDKLRPRRECPPRVIAIYFGPPEEKAELGFTMPFVRYIDARQNASVAPIAEMVTELLS
jgi:hypothetical protein